jgi:hypothetical protein
LIVHITIDSTWYCQRPSNRLYGQMKWINNKFVIWFLFIFRSSSGWTTISATDPNYCKVFFVNDMTVESGSNCHPTKWSFGYRKQYCFSIIDFHSQYSLLHKHGGEETFSLLLLLLLLFESFFNNLKQKKPYGKNL